MKKIRIISIRKNTDPRIASLENDYLNRLNRWIAVGLEDLRQKYTASLSPDQILQSERRLIEKKIDPHRRPLVVLHASGKMLTSGQFARWLKKQMEGTSSGVDFLIGGPYGLDREFLKRASSVLSLTPLTLTHEHARLLLIEAIYRSATLWHNVKYSK